jgi:hypothetical protein
LVDQIVACACCSTENSTSRMDTLISSPIRTSDVPTAITEARLTAAATR